MPRPTLGEPAPCIAPASLEPSGGGTLALSTFCVRTPNLPAADKIARNLAMIAWHPEAPVAFNTVCARLFIEWLGPLQVRDAARGNEWRGVWPMHATTR